MLLPQRFLVPATALSFLLLAGCARERDTGPGITTTTSPCDSAGAEDDGVPPPPDGAATPDASELVFAVSRFHLGHLGENGAPDSEAWQAYGFNLDRTASTRKALCTCRPVGGLSASGSAASGFADGPLGRDNNFGQGLLPILASLDSTFEEATNADVEAGTFSWLFRLAGVGAEPEYTGLAGSAYEGAALVGADGEPTAPLFDGSDVWPLAEEGLEGGDPASPRLRFVDAYTVARADGAVWVGRGEGTIRLLVPYLGTTRIRAVIHDPVLVLPLSPDRKTIAGGMLGGTLDTQELVMELTRVAGFFGDGMGGSYCPPSSTLESILQQVRLVSDMLAGGALDGDVTCDRISVGFGFDASPAQLGDVAPALPVQDPCARK